MNKLNNKKVKYKYQGQDIVFDSKMEFEYFIEVILKNKLKFEFQPKFILQEGFTTKDGKKIRPITYTADFLIYEGKNKVIIEIKGLATNEFKLKKKMFLYKFPDLEYKMLIKYDGKFVDWEENEKRKRMNKKLKNT